MLTKMDSLLSNIEFLSTREEEDLEVEVTEVAEEEADLKEKEVEALVEEEAKVKVKEEEEAKEEEIDLKLKVEEVEVLLSAESIEVEEKFVSQKIPLNNKNDLHNFCDLEG